MENKKKYLGIWMDHANAHLIEFATGSSENKTISSKFTHQAKEDSLQKGEYQMHSREQHQQLEYYNDLADIIKNYNHVLLFGPTDAKTELNNILKENHLFEKITIDLKQTDKMTDNQQHAFVKTHFSK